MIKKISIIILIIITISTKSIEVTKLEKNILQFKMDPSYDPQKQSELTDTASHFPTIIGNKVKYSMSKNEFLISEIRPGVDRIHFTVLELDDGLDNSGQGDILNSSCDFPILFYTEISEENKDESIPNIVYDKEEKIYTAFNILATNYDFINNLERLETITFEKNLIDKFDVIINKAVNYAAISYCFDEYVNDEEEFIFQIHLENFLYVESIFHRTLNASEDNLTKGMIFKSKSRTKIYIKIKDPYEILIALSNTVSQKNTKVNNLNIQNINSQEKNPDSKTINNNNSKKFTKIPKKNSILPKNFQKSPLNLSETIPNPTPSYQTVPKTNSNLEITIKDVSKDTNNKLNSDPHRIPSGDFIIEIINPTKDDQTLAIKMDNKSDVFEIWKTIVIVIAIIIAVILIVIFSIWLYYKCVEKKKKKKKQED